MYDWIPQLIQLHHIQKKRIIHIIHEATLILTDIK